jgi:hypothetical protein
MLGVADNFSAPLGIDIPIIGAFVSARLAIAIAIRNWRGYYLHRSSSLSSTISAPLMTTSGADSFIISQSRLTN